MKEKIKTYMDVGLYMYLLIGIILLTIIISVCMNIQDAKSEQLQEFIVECVLLSIIWYIANRRKQSFIAQAIRNRPENNIIKMSILLSGSIVVVYGNLTFLLSKLPSIKEEFLSFKNMLTVSTDESIVMSILSIAIIAPIIEEIIFRGFIYQILRKWLTIKWAIILQGILFGVLHIHAIDQTIIGINTLMVIFSTISGITYGYIIYKSKSIWPAIIMHIILNLLFTIIGELPEVLEFNTYLSGIILVIGMLSIWIISKKIKNTPI